MKISGIICELNPPHRGHTHLISETKKRTNCNYVVAIMSGNFVQRGTPAIYDYQTRARMAINIGFDAVIYLPTAYTVCAADDFAKNAVQIANKLNIDYLSFGVTKNCEEIATLKTIIENEPLHFKAALETKLTDGESYSTAYMRALEEVSQISNINANDILAVQYMLNLSETITPIAIERLPNVSATQLRNEIYAKNFPTIASLVDEKNYNIIKNAHAFDNVKYQTFLYDNLITKTKDDIKQIRSIKEGLENKIISTLNETLSFEEFNSAIQNKRYTQHFLNRLYSSIALKIQNETDLALPYIKVVAVKDAEILKHLSSTLPIVSNLKNKALLQEKNVYSIDTIACRTYNCLTNILQPSFPYHKLIIHNM